ncbi:hypothetical protein COOONC_06912 [Cooperia oncophora]
MVNSCRSQSCGLKANIPIFFSKLYSKVLQTVFTYSCIRHGKVTSGGLFISWLLFTICGLPEMLYWSRLREIHLMDGYRKIAHMIWWPLCLVQLLLHCSADPCACASKVTSSPGNPSPELLSSFISRITMWWFNDMCKKGVKKPLEVCTIRRPSELIRPHSLLSFIR